tara:strand:+ start:116 stop:400 length:285 start_codon:yes stop_codon:yes gene_type:complete
MNAVVHQPQNLRFALIETDDTAEITYELAGNTVIITHTFVPTAWRGRGVASTLARTLLDWVAKEDRTVESQCSYATTFLARHAEYRHLQSSKSD